jgi:hypothetical protein
MSQLGRILDLLPSPYSVADDSVLAQVLSVIALEMEAYREDLDRKRQTHWINTCYRLEDAEKLGALVGVSPFSWEDLREFRVRLLATVKARLNGAVGPNEIREFVYDYLFKTEGVTGTTLVPGLQTVTLEQAYQGPKDRPLFRKLALVENPVVRRESPVLVSRNGNVPYLFRWEEQNHGLDDSTVRLDVTGVIGSRTVTPVIVNLTTGDMIGFRGRISFGKVLTINASDADPAQPRLARATLDGADVTNALFSMEGFRMGQPFHLNDLAAHPMVPRIRRGINQWIFLSIGMYDVPGLNRFFNSIAGDDLQEARFNEAHFDHALFPSGAIARLAMSWNETVPATFEVQVPQFVVIEPEGSNLHELVAQGLEETVAELRVAGVQSRLRQMPFLETQKQIIKATVPWIVLDREKGSPGQDVDLAFGGQFGESPLGSTRFE